MQKAVWLQGANHGSAEFQKILDHRSLVPNEPIGALAYLQIGRAYAKQSDIAKAKVAYKDFLTLWKDADADADIPILIAAKSEYAKLHTLKRSCEETRIQRATVW